MNRWRRTKWLLGVLGSIVVLIVVAIACLPRTPNPVYKGVSLTQWLRFYHLHIERTYSVLSVNGQVIAPNIPREDPREREAADALRAIGKDGVPLLMEWLTGTRGNLKARLFSRLGWTPFLPRSLRVRFSATAGVEYQKNVIAFNALKELGADASPAIPQLEELASTAVRDDDATLLLTSIGPAAVPALSNALRRNNNPARQIQLLHALSSFGPTSSEAVTSIVPLLQQFDPAVAAAAARALGEIHQHSEVAVSALIGVIGRSPVSVEGQAISALGQFGGNASDAVTVLSAYCGDPVLGGAARSSLNKIQDASLRNPLELEGSFLSVP